MLNNIHYLQQSINSPEPLLDDFYIFSNWDSNIEKYVNDTKKIKEILTTIKILIDKKLNIDNELYIDLINLLNRYGNKSEFACFLTACDYNLENINKNNIKLVKEITNLFLEKRGICDFTYKEWIQAILDCGASRKKSKCGENKLIKLANNFGYKFVKDMDSLFLEKKCVAKLTKDDDFSIENIRNKLNVDLNFNNQNKILDVLLKNKEDYFFIEAKHIKTFGGEQDKQIVELINIIKKNTGNNNIHFVAFLDGNYSNHLLTNSIFEQNTLINNKLLSQQKDILESLKINKSNLWINTAGFYKLLKDLK